VSFGKAGRTKQTTTGHVNPKNDAEQMQFYCIKREKHKMTATTEMVEIIECGGEKWNG